MRPALLIPLLAAAVALGGCTTAPATDPNAPVITGRAHYKARITMPAAAVFEATLEDVSRADAPSVVVAQVRLTNLQPPPFRFTLPYDPAKIVPGHRYVVRGRITLSEAVRFRTVTSAPVLGPDAIKHVELQLEGDGGSFKPLPGT